MSSNHHLADDNREAWRWFQADPYSRFHPAELDPVDLAVFLHDVRDIPYEPPCMHVSTYSPSPSPSLIQIQAEIRRRRRQRGGRRPMSIKRARIPAASNAILGLKEVLLTTTMLDHDDDCAICLKPLADPADQQDKEETAVADVEIMTSRLRAMPCSHIFHQHYIFQWLHRKAVCPLCRHQLPTTEDVEEEDDDDEDDDDDDDDDDNDDEEEEQDNNDDNDNGGEEQQQVNDSWFPSVIPDD